MKQVRLEGTMKIYIDFDDVICETAKYFTKIAKELFALECEQRRLTYFIGLLDKRQAEVIRLVFVDGIPTKEVAASFGLTYRTIDRIKRTAIENLAEMYAYSDQFRV